MIFGLKGGGSERAPYDIDRGNVEGNISGWSKMRRDDESEWLADRESDNHPADGGSGWRKFWLEPQSAVTNSETPESPNLTARAQTCEVI